MEQHPAGGQPNLVFTEHQNPKATQFNPKNKGISIIDPGLFFSVSANSGLSFIQRSFTIRNGTDYLSRDIHTVCK
jgi:hypothetical protein